jgi:hypothetical protein
MIDKHSGQVKLNHTRAGAGRPGRLILGPRPLGVPWSTPPPAHSGGEGGAMECAVDPALFPLDWVLMQGVSSVLQGRSCVAFQSSFAILTSSTRLDLTLSGPCFSRIVEDESYKIHGRIVTWDIERIWRTAGDPGRCLPPPTEGLYDPRPRVCHTT